MNTSVSSMQPSMNRRRVVALVARFREFGILAVLVVLGLFVQSQNSRFLSLDNLKGILLYTSILVILAVGETVVILSRNIDISISSTLGFSALAVGVILHDHPGIPVVFALLIGAAIGLCFGLGNGVLVAFGRVPAIIATLGTFGVYRGLVFVFSTITNHLEITAADLPASLSDLATQTVVFLSIPLLVMIVVAYWLRQTRSGREVYAVGGNPVAARLAGINSARITLIAFALSGALAGLAGVLWTALYAQVDTLAGTGLELTAIASVVIGGTTTLGGVGGILGTLIGCTLLGAIYNGLTLLSGPGEAQFWQQAVYGAIILGAVIADALISRRLQLALRRRRV